MSLNLFREKVKFSSNKPCNFADGTIVRDEEVATEQAGLLSSGRNVGTSLFERKRRQQERLIQQSSAPEELLSSEPVLRLVVSGDEFSDKTLAPHEIQEAHKRLDAIETALNAKLNAVTPQALNARMDPQPIQLLDAHKRLDAIETALNAKLTPFESSHVQQAHERLDAIETALNAKLTSFESSQVQQAHERLDAIETALDAKLNVPRPECDIQTTHKKLDHIEQAQSVKLNELGMQNISEIQQRLDTLQQKLEFKPVVDTSAHERLDALQRQIMHTETQALAKLETLEKLATRLETQFELPQSDLSAPPKKDFDTPLDHSAPPDIVPEVGKPKQAQQKLDSPFKFTLGDYVNAKQYLVQLHQKKAALLR